MFTARARRLAAAILTGGLLVGGVVTAGPAMAGTTGGGGGGDGGHHFAPQVFIIHQEGVNATTGTVQGFGPIAGRGTDTVTSDSTDLFSFRKGDVTVAHKALFDKQETNRRACTVTIFEKGAWWIVPPGTGKYTHARSKDGRYAAVVVLYFRHHHEDNAKAAAMMGGGGGHHCHIDMNKPPKDQTLDVFAAGKVSLGHHHHD